MFLWVLLVLSRCGKLKTVKAVFAKLTNEEGKLSKKQKLIEKLKARSRNFEYDEAESMLLSLGFKKSNKGKSSGTKVVFKSEHSAIEMHKPHPQKNLSRTLRRRFWKYWKVRV